MIKDIDSILNDIYEIQKKKLELEFQIKELSKEKEKILEELKEIKDIDINNIEATLINMEEEIKSIIETIKDLKNAI